MMQELLILTVLIVVALFVIVTIVRVADRVLGDDTPHHKVDLTYNPLAVDWDINVPSRPVKQDLRYDPLSNEDTGWVPIRPVKIGNPDEEPIVTKEQVDDYLAKVRAEVKPRS